MRQIIRALGWAIKILSIIVVLLPITVAFSLVKLLEPKAIGVGEPTTSFSNGTVSLSAPFYINNTGFYELSNINITVIARSGNKTVARFSKLLPNVPANSLLNTSYDISFSLEEIVSNNSELLTRDTDINLTIWAFFRVAYAIAFGISLNTTMPWGAPFYNLSITDARYNSTSQKFSISMTFENHAYFPIKRTVTIKIYSNRDEPLGSIDEYLDVSAGTSFQARLEIPVEQTKMTEDGVFRIFFENVQVVEGRWILSE